MSAVYCGSKRSYFEDIPSPPPSSKRFRCYSPSDSPIWSPPPSSSLDQLRTAFPHLQLTVLVKALEEHGSDLCAAMRSLHTEKRSEELAAAGEETHAVAGGTFTDHPASGDDWVALLIREVTQSTGIDDAKLRATKVLEALEHTLSSRAREEARTKFQEEKVAVQQQVEDLMKDNTVLKRAVAIQHERQKAFEDANQQVDLLKQVIPQYQDKIRNLEGLTPFATHLTLKYTLRMGSNAMFQSAFKDSETGKVSNHGRLLSGFGAGVLEALAIVTPFEVVKIRLQQQKGLSPELFKYKGPIHCARTIVREESILGLWSGAAPTVMRNGTNQAVMFTAKNSFDVLLWNKHEGDGKPLQPWQSMISGFLAGTAGPFCTGPFDVVKTRLMAQTRDGEGGLKYKGMVHAIRTIYAEEGLVALWRGLLPRLMRIPPGQAIMWAVADQVTGLYEKRYLLDAPL